MPGLIDFRDDLPTNIALNPTFGKAVNIFTGEHPGGIIFILGIATIRTGQTLQSPGVAPLIAGGISFGIATGDQPARPIILVMALMAGTVLITLDLTAIVPPEAMRVLQRIGAGDQVTLRIPREAGYPAQRIDYRHHIARNVVLVFPDRTVRQDFFQWESVRRMPGGDGGSIRRIAHHRQVGTLVIAVFPYPSTRRLGCHQQLACPAPAPVRPVAVGVFRNTAKFIPAMQGGSAGKTGH